MEYDSRHYRRIENTPVDSGRMWPLDAAIGIVGGLIAVLIWEQIGFDDPRLLHNGYTYLIAVPCVSLMLAFVMRATSNRFVQKSIQLGFLVSVCIHLMLLIFSIYYIPFSSYQPTASKGEQRERTPIRKTVPEHIFQVPRESDESPDWSEPIEAETTSPVIPKEQRQLPPIERTQPRLEVPKPRQPENQPMQKYLMQRQQASQSQPMPSDAPGKLARRESQLPVPKPVAESIEVPQSTGDSSSPAPATPTERQVTLEAGANSSRDAPTRLEMASAAAETSPTTRPSPTAPAAASRSTSDALPTVGDAGISPVRRSRTIAPPAAVAGAAPAPVTVGVARTSSDASMMLAPVDLNTNRTGQTIGAQISSGQAPSFMSESTQPTPTGGAAISRDALMAAVGAPNVDPGSAAMAPGRSRRISVARGASPMGSINPVESIPSTGNSTSGSSDSQQLNDRLGQFDSLAPRSNAGIGAPSSDLAPGGASSLPLDLMAEIGPVGIGRVASPAVGLIPSEVQPEVAAMELPRQARPRRQVGGPATPAGTEIAAVESFSRRVMRTSGGAASSAPGLGGPATEEAIERGLAYLASVQNEDGSWSLQGHGDPVVLRSDTAATGLCLLAFQGAGYTHKQHQYAEVVSGGLKFLLDNQRTNGNLYRRENTISDRNVMFYSHGIAALALCEAYGMTQDPDLRIAAQDSLDYIMATQHRDRGGWRYSPQVSSDTSVTGWMMMALKSGDLAGLSVTDKVYAGIDRWLTLARQDAGHEDRYRYNPFAPDTPQQRHGRLPTPTMTAVGMLMRMYNGWRRDHPAMQSAASYLLKYPPRLGDRRRPLRDGYYWYYATQFMFHMGGDYWEQWNAYLNPLLLETQIKVGPEAGSWDPELPIRDRWSAHAGRLYVTTMNLLNLEVYYRHLPIYEDTAAE